MRTPTTWLLLCALAAAPAARAETAYVVEQLVVSVNSVPDASGERIATVKSGERLEVIERVRDEVHVQLAGGKDGWIRASYLSADEPLRPRLAASTAEVARLKEELGRLQAQLDAARTTAGAAPGGALPPQRRRPRPPRRTPPARRRGRCLPARCRRTIPGAGGRGRSLRCCWRCASGLCSEPWCSTGTSAASTAACASTSLAEPSWLRGAQASRLRIPKCAPRRCAWTPELPRLGFKAPVQASQGTAGRCVCSASVDHDQYPAQRF